MMAAIATAKPTTVTLSTDQIGLLAALSRGELVLDAARELRLSDASAADLLAQARDVIGVHSNRAAIRVLQRHGVITATCAEPSRDQLDTDPEA
jgi:hypothetical protein